MCGCLLTHQLPFFNALHHVRSNTTQWAIPFYRRTPPTDDKLETLIAIGQLLKAVFTPSASGRIDQAQIPMGHYSICSQPPRAWHFEPPGTGQRAFEPGTTRKITLNPLGQLAFQPPRHWYASPPPPPPPGQM